MEDRIRELTIVIIAGCCAVLIALVLGMWPAGKNLEQKIVGTVAPAASSSAQVAVRTMTASGQAAVADILVQPASIIQGDPIMVIVSTPVTEGPSTSSASSRVTRITCAGEPLGIFLYDKKTIAFAGIDLNKKPGTYTLTATFADGKMLTKNIVVQMRKKVVAPLGIPISLGGNTPAAATSLISTLAADNKVLAGFTSAVISYWTQGFQFPVADPVVTDSYGYTRSTVGFEIAHKGTDFAAVSGTPVMAINRGVVIYAGGLGAYGNTVAVDHGLGVQSFYMHLSQIDVHVGQMLERGHVVGASGETGYAEGPHLHLTVRIGGVSIDPIIFLNFFK